MKKITTTLVLTILTLFAFAQTNADVIGEWYNAEKDAVITIFEENKNSGTNIRGIACFFL